MGEDQVERRLAAILAADVVGYSRLMGLDESGTLSAFKAHRRELVDAKIAEHQGRIVKLTGDGLLVEFPSVVNAVACAADIQHKMRERNADVPQDRRIEFRIGVNLGDIIIEDGDIFGDGVNIAARIESIARPGGVAVSGSVRDSIGNRLELTFEDTGEQTLKNIERPVRVYNVNLFPGAPASAPAKVGPAATTQQSIAVLPFNNMSGDPEQEYFSDGISEDIITDLSKIAGLMVVARNSSFAYKNKSPDIRAVGRELGVASVLEGSIRRAGNRVRITAQLIDAASGGHLWAERYDRDLTDIFAVQDEVTLQIVDALKVKLRPEEKQLIADGRTTNVEAHDCFLRGRELLTGTTKNREIFELAVANFRRAIELDPNYAEPYAGLGMACNLDFQNQWTGTSDALDRGADFVAQAIEKGPNESYAYYVSAVIKTWQGDLERAKAAAEKALLLNPNSSLANSARGAIEIYGGGSLAAVPYFERAILLDPVYKQQYLHFLGLAYLVAGEYAIAADALRERVRLAPGTDLSRSLLASALGHLGEIDEARRVWQELKDISPAYSFARHMARSPFQNPADRERIREGLAKARLPD